jgi:hypothetical protein
VAEGCVGAFPSPLPRRQDTLVAGIVWHAAINFWAPVFLSDSSLTAAREGTQLPTIAANLYLTVSAV